MKFIQLRKNKMNSNLKLFNKKIKMKIAFGYKMGSGKDISIKYLISNYGGKKISFSDPLYNILHYAQKICGFKFEKDRKFLQFIGTEWAREKDPDIWVKLALQTSNKIEINSESENIYCSDLRFLNEFQSLKNNGWILIKLVRNTVNNFRKGSGSTDHISENDLDKTSDSDWDYVIKNNDTLEELFLKLDKIVQIELEKKNKNNFT